MGVLIFLLSIVPTVHSKDYLSGTILSFLGDVARLDISRYNSTLLGPFIENPD